MKTKIYSKTNENFPKTKEVREKILKKVLEKVYEKRRYENKNVHENTKTKMCAKIEGKKGLERKWGGGSTQDRSVQGWEEIDRWTN